MQKQPVLYFGLQEYEIRRLAYAGLFLGLVVVFCHIFAAQRTTDTVPFPLGLGGVLAATVLVIVWRCTPRGERAQGFIALTLLTLPVLVIGLLERFLP